MRMELLLSRNLTLPPRGFCISAVGGNGVHSYDCSDFGAGNLTGFP